MSKKLTYQAAKAVFINTALLTAGLFSALIGIWSLYKGTASLALLGILAGLFLVFAANIEKLEKLKTVGMEAKIRRLDAAIDKAETGLEQLKSLTRIMSAELIILSSSMGRKEAIPSLAKARNLAHEIRNNAKMVGLSDSDIRDILEPWLRAETGDLVARLCEPVEFEVKEIILGLINNTKYNFLSIAEKSLLQQRAQTLSDHFAGFLANFRKLEKVKMLPDLIGLIQAAPEISEQKKSELVFGLLPFQTEVEYFIRHLDYKDFDLWQAVVIEKV